MERCMENCCTVILAAAITCKRLLSLEYSVKIYVEDSLDVPNCASMSSPDTNLYGGAPYVSDSIAFSSASIEDFADECNDIQNHINNNVNQVVSNNIDNVNNSYNTECYMNSSRNSYNPNEFMHCACTGHECEGYAVHYREDISTFPLMRWFDTDPPIASLLINDSCNIQHLSTVLLMEIGNIPLVLDTNNTDNCINNENNLALAIVTAINNTNSTNGNMNINKCINDNSNNLLPKAKAVSKGYTYPNNTISCIETPPIIYSQAMEIESL